MIAEAMAGLQLYLRNGFNVKSNSASELQVLGCFSEANPIDNLVQTARKNSTVPHACVIEACSGSGKSLCAADYFVRNPGTS
eukprot:50887-Hanusia_phi.AAC.1